MADSVSDKAPSLTSPARNVAAVTPSDSEDLANVAKAIEVHVAGDIKVTTIGGVTITKPFFVGYHPLVVTRIWSTGTTASGIYALYD